MFERKIIVIFTATFLLFAFSPTFAQFTPTAQDSIPQDSLIVSDEDERNKPLGDTTAVFWKWNTRGPSAWQPLDTSLQDFEYPQWQHGRRTYEDYSGLGKMGTPLQALVWEPELRQGFRVGMDALSPYRLRLEDIKTYKIGRKRPFTNLYFSMIDLQNSVIRSSFAHQASPNFYYSLQYGVLNTVGFFNGHRSRHENLSMHLRYQKDKYTANFYIITNGNDQSENGGIQTDTLNTQLQSFLATEAVALNVNTEGWPKHENRHQQFVYRQNWQNVAVDTNGNVNKANLKLEHEISFENHRYKYFDKAPDSSFYRIYQVNPRGLRHYITHQELQNELSYTQALGGNLDQSALVIRAFAAHRYHWVNQEPEQFQLQNIVFGGSIYDQLEGPLGFRADASVSTSRQGLDLWLKGKLDYALKDWAKIEGWTVFQRYEPDQMSRRLFVSRNLFWENPNLTQTQEFSLYGRLSWPKFRGSFQLGNHTITNPIYFDTSALVQQLNGSANILQLELNQNFKLGVFHLDNRAVWQRVLAGGEVYRLPELLLRSQLYYQGRPYKTVFMRTGFSFRYMSAFQTNAYFPLTGKFHLQEDQQLSFYPVVDVFLSVKIWQLRFFVNAENLTYYIWDQQNYYEAPFYAQPNFVIRIGASWQLFD
jgi:hypothetical protein